MKSTRGHAAQASGKHAVHLEVDGPGGDAESGPLPQFLFRAPMAPYFHIDLI